MSATSITHRRWFRALWISAALIAGIAIGTTVVRPPDLIAKAKPIVSDSASAGRVTIETVPRPAATGFDSERVWSSYNDWEPAIAADPSSAYVYQLTTRYNGLEPCHRCAGPYIIFRRSSDGGVTWQADKFLTPYSKAHNDPQIEVATDGVIYAAWLNDYTPGVKFIKSTNHGDTWSTPIAITAKAGKPSWSDKPILAISPTGKDVYIAFNASDAYVVASHDFGKTFSKPIKTSNDTRYWFHNGGAVAPNGDVYFSAVDYSQDYTGVSHINVLKSTNGGITFTTTLVDTAQQMPDCTAAQGCTLGFFGPSAALAIDKAGLIMIAYNAGNTTPGQPQKMFVRTSTNGTTWSARQEISNGVATVNNGFPALAAGPARGDFRVAWQDDRNGATTAWNTWYRRTIDGGATWTAAVQLSDQGTGAAYKTPKGYAFPYGDYFEIAVDSAGTAHVIWSEGTSYAGPGGSWYTRGK
jgi:hypothetical protein